MSLVECPDCGIRIKDNVDFCESCGAALKKECPNCHSKVRWDKNFCPSCGTNYNERTTAHAGECLQ